MNSKYGKWSLHFPHSLTGQRGEIVCQMKRRLLLFRTRLEEHWTIKEGNECICIAAEGESGSVLVQSRVWTNVFTTENLRRRQGPHSGERREGLSKGTIRLSITRALSRTLTDERQRVMRRRTLLTTLRGRKADWSDCRVCYTGIMCASSHMDRREVERPIR